MSRNRFASLLVLPALVLPFVGCAPLDSTRQVCRLMPELDSSTVALDRAFGDLAKVDPAVLESSLNVLIDTFSSLLDAPPAEIEEALAVLDRAYREVRLALVNVDFDGKIAVNDLATINALSGLRRSDVIRANDRLETFVEQRCNTELESPVPPALGDGDTLPTPIQTPDEVEEYPFVVEDEPSSLTAYGYLLVSGREVTLDDTQAECVGRTVSNAVQDGVAVDDESMTVLVSRALDKCAGSTATSSTVPVGTND